MGSLLIVGWVGFQRLPIDRYLCSRIWNTMQVNLVSDGNGYWLYWLKGIVKGEHVMHLGGGTAIILGTRFQHGDMHDRVRYCWRAVASMGGSGTCCNLPVITHGAHGRISKQELHGGWARDDLD